MTLQNKLVIFDFDGVFCDSEGVAQIVWNEYFQKKYGKSISKEYWYKHLKSITHSDKSKILKDDKNYDIFLSDEELNHLLREGMDRVNTPGAIELTENTFEVLDICPNRCSALAATLIAP